MYKNDDELYRLNNLPLMMAGDDDEDDDIFDDDLDDDLIDEPLDDDLDDDDLDDDLDKATSAPARESGGGGASVERDATGITRGAMGFGALALTSIIPLVLLLLYMIKGAGLSSTAMLFMICFFVGFILSIWTFVYYNSGNKSFSKFDLRSYFKWSEILVISVILISVSIYNLSNLPSGNALRLSSESTMVTNNSSDNSPEPIFAPKPPDNIENEETLFQSNEFTPAQNNRATAAPKKTVAPTAPKRVFRRVPAAPRSNIVKKQSENVIGTSEDEEALIDSIVENAVNVAEISAGSYNPDANQATQTNENQTSDNKMSLPVNNMEVETPPLVSKLFLGGVLAGALGYAFPLALAGAILGMFRKFNHPFSAKTKEEIDDETGEVVLITDEQTKIQKALDFIFRSFIGFNIGGTIGFLLGVAITIPLYILFWNTAQTEPLIANFLITLGVVRNPDLAYSTGLILAGIMVPLIMLVVGKGSPAGMSITEEKVRQAYSIPVTINKVSTDVASIPEPAIISFDLDDEDSSSRGGSMDDFEDEDESFTEELLSEFGVELENVFDMKVDLPAKSNGDNGKVSKYEKQKVNSILENSLGELGNVTVQVSAELGKATMLLTDWLNLSEGMLIELDKPVSEEIDILINDVCKGKGKLAVIDNKLSVKVSKSNFSQSEN